MKEFNPHEGHPPKEKNKVEGPDYKAGYRFIIGYLEDHRDEVFTKTDFNFIKGYLMQNCGM